MSDDLISRKAVLEILYDISCRNYGGLATWGINKACDFIEHAETAFDKKKMIDIIARANSAITIGDKDKALYWTKKLEEIVEKGGIE